MELKTHTNYVWSWLVTLKAGLITPCFVRSKVVNKYTYWSIYVDDLLISGLDMKLIADVKNVLQSHFQLKDFGSLSYFLELEITRLIEGTVLNHPKYTLELISESDLAGATYVPTPMMQNLKLTTS